METDAVEIVLVFLQKASPLIGKMRKFSLFMSAKRGFRRHYFAEIETM